jgi:hypothetical protein
MARYPKSTNATQTDSVTPLPADPVINAYAWWLDHAGEFSNEAIRFVNHRLGKDLEAAQQLMKCDDTNEALALQARFAKELAADYLDEGRKMIDLMAQAATPPSSNQRNARRLSSH